MFDKKFLMENGIDNLKSIKDLEVTIKELKNTFKSEEKKNSEMTKKAVIDKVNNFIKSGVLTANSKVIVKYKDRIVNAIVKTVPTLDSKNLSLVGDEFDNKEGKIYCVKSKFISFADEVEKVEEAVADIDEISEEDYNSNVEETSADFDFEA